MMGQRPRLHLAPQPSVKAQPPESDGDFLYPRLEIPLIIHQHGIIGFITGIPILIVIPGVEEGLPIFGKRMFHG